MRARSMFSVAAAAALIAAGISALPGAGAQEFIAFEGSATFPDTIDGIPIDQAPPRAVVRADRAALADLAQTPPATAEADAGSVRARALSSDEVDLDADTLGESDRELLASLGVIDADQPLPPAPVDLDDEVAATLLAAVVSDHLDIEVDAEPIIDEWFALAGTDADGLADLDVIISAEEPLLGMIFADPPAEPWFGEQWGLDNTGQTIFGQPGVAGMDIDWVDASAHATGDGVVVAVIDTAFDTSHPDLAGRFVGGWNFVTNTANVATTSSAAHHGTHVAGTIAARINGIGVAGVAPDAQIMPLVVAVDGQTAFTLDRVAQAVRFAADNGADVINASLGTEPLTSWPSNDDFGGLRRAIEYAGEQGVTFVVAAGNQGVDIDQTPVYPASYAYDGRVDNVLAVSAMDNLGEAWGGSGGGTNTGARTVGLTAPGVRVLSTLAGGGYGYGTGTSMAAPHVAGIAALALEQQPAIDPVAVIDHLVGNGVTLTNWIGATTSGNRASAAGVLGVSTEVLVAFSTLSGQVGLDEDTAEVATTLEVTAPDEHEITEATISLVTRVDGQMYAVVEHPLTTSDEEVLDGTTHHTDLEGSIRAALNGGATALAVTLPPGDYAWVVEFDDPSLGAHLAAFQVTQEMLPTDDDPGDDEPGGDPGDGTPPGSDPGDDDAAGPDGSGGEESQPGSGGTPTPPGTDPGTDPGAGSPPPASDGGSTPTDGGSDSGSGGSTPPPPSDNTGGGTPPTSSPGTPPPSGNDTTGTPPASSTPDDSGGGSVSPPPASNPDPPSDSGAGSTPETDDSTGTGPPPSSGGGSDDDADAGAPAPDSGSPTTSRVRPAEGRADTLVDIHGNWPSQVLVRFGDQPAYVSTVIEGVLVSVKAPAAASAGAVDVVVLSTNLEVLEVFSGGFTYLEGGGSTAPPPVGWDDGGGGGTGGDGGGSPPPSGGGGGTGGDGGGSPPPSGHDGGDGGGSVPPPPDGGTTPPPSHGGSTPPPPDSGSTPPPPDGGSAPPPGDDGSVPPPPDGGSTPPPPSDGGSAPPPSDPGSSPTPPPAPADPTEPTGPRTVGDVQSVNGLNAVSLGSGHPAHQLPGTMWPPACTAHCTATRAVT